MSSPSASLVDHIFIIRALVLRNLRLRHLSQPVGFMLEFVRPMISCVAHYFVFWAVNKRMPPGVSLEQYIWAAFTVWLTFIQIYTGLQHSTWSKAPPFPGVTRMHMRLATCVWSVMVMVAFCYGSVAIFMIFGDNIRFPDIPLTALILAITVALGWGLGLLVEGICRAVPLVSPIFHLLPYFMFVSAGIYFTAASAPPQLAVYYLYSPVLHLIEYERYAFCPGYPIALLSLSYPAICAAAALALGLTLNRSIRYKPGE